MRRKKEKVLKDNAGSMRKKNKKQLNDGKNRDGNAEKRKENSIEKVIVVLVVKEAITTHSLKNLDVAGKLDFFAASGMDFNILLIDTDVPNLINKIFVTPASGGVPLDKCCHKWEDRDELMEKLNERERRIDSLEIYIKGLGRILTEKPRKEHTAYRHRKVTRWKQCLKGQKQKIDKKRRH